VSFWKARQHGSRQWPELTISASSRINAMVLPSKAYEEISGGRRDVKTDPVRCRGHKWLHDSGPPKYGMITLITSYNLEDNANLNKSQPQQPHLL
jgi:hypothetical protein